MGRQSMNKQGKGAPRAAELFLPQRNRLLPDIMKRVAESQLTKDGAENDADDSQELSTEFQLADPTTLATRKIRSLPKRALMVPSPTPTLTSVAAASTGATVEEFPERASRFSGFKGFGTSTHSEFSFTLPVSQTDSQLQASPATSGKFPLTTPPTKPSKGFSFFTTSNPTPPSTPPLASDNKGNRDAAHKYCLSLRGLNSSFFDAVAEAIKEDPFVDIAQILEKYKSLRHSIQADFDKSFSVSGSNQGKTDGTPPVKTVPSMPVPPKTAFAFTTNTSTVGTPISHGAGFTPKKDQQSVLSSSPFAWPAKPSTSTPAPEKPVHPDVSQPGISDNKDASSKASVTSGAQTSTFGSSTFTFGVDKPAATGTGESKPVDSSEKALDGKEKVQEKASPAFSFNFKPSVPASPLTPGFSSFLSPSKSPDVSDNMSTQAPTKPASTNSSLPSPPFGFGAGKNSQPFSPFGKGSIGNPVGFAFGSPPTTPSAAGSSSLTPAVTTEGAPEVGSEAHEGSAPSHDPSPVPSQSGAYDGDGPGEEDETTIYETRAKAYKMLSTGDKKGWVSVGSGQLKLKGRMDILKQRILMRNSSTGQIILNFNLFHGFTITTDKKSISFRVPGEGETAAVYQLRVPSEADAVKWQEVVRAYVDDAPPSHDS